MLAGNRFVFETPGTYELRAVAQCSGMRIESRPLTILVKQRDAASLERILKSVRGVPLEFTPDMTAEEKKRRILLSRGSDKFWKLGATEFEGEVGEGLQQLEDVGGNIASGVKNLTLMERILSGEERTGDDVLAYIRKRMDPLNAEVAIPGASLRETTRLGQFDQGRGCPSIPIQGRQDGRSWSSDRCRWSHALSCSTSLSDLPSARGTGAPPVLSQVERISDRSRRRKPHTRGVRNRIVDLSFRLLTPVTPLVERVGSVMPPAGGGQLEPARRAAGHSLARASG